MEKTTIEITDVMKLDIRVGKVVSAEPVPKSKKLLKLRVDLGEKYGEVTILSGISEFYSPDDITGNTYPFIANLQPRELMGFTSQGMILAADNGTRPILIPLDSSLSPGDTLR